jgi:autotransporter-associated beta strand protein
MMRKCRVVAVLLAYAVTRFASAVDLQPIVVAQGESAAISSVQTNSSLTVHGTLTVTSKLYLVPGTHTVGPDAGDEGQMLVNGAYNMALVGSTNAGQNLLFLIGSSGGRGGVTVSGPTEVRPQGYGYDPQFAYRFLFLTQHTNAKSDTGTNDLLTLNDGGIAGPQKLENDSTSAVARVRFNGGLYYLSNQWDNNTKFVSASGARILLESVDGHPIQFYTYQSGATPSFNSGTVETTGSGDVVLCGRFQDYYMLFNAVTWNHTGKTRLTGDFYMRLNANEATPCGAGKSSIYLESSDSRLDLNGKATSVNDLIGPGKLTNNSPSTATLKMGTWSNDCYYSAKFCGSNAINLVKSGTGTLTVTNGVLPNVSVTGGTLVVRPKSGTASYTAGSLSLAADTTLVVDGTKLLVSGFTDEGATVTFLNGGTIMNTVTTTSDTITDGSVLGEDGLLVKAGAGALTVCRDSAFGADLRIVAGTLRFAAPGTTNRWFRFTFKGMYIVSGFELSEMMLMNRSGARVDGGGSSTGLLSPVTNAPANAEPANMAPQSVWASDQNWILSEPAGGYRDRTPSALFDGQSWTRLRYGTLPTLSDSTSWKKFVVRLPSAAGVTASYNFRNGYSGTTHPTHWAVESSPDGINWTTVSQYTYVTPPSGVQQYYNNGVHYKINTGDMAGAGGFSPSSLVQVGSGATLDCSLVTGGQEVSKLAVDATAGGGTLKNVKFAADGALYLTNFPAGTKLSNYEIPLTFAGVTGTAAVRSWTVYVDGVVRTDIRLAFIGGKLVVFPLGTVISVN